jgi:1-acyl-sn-glycerol-3-phosphate acyltransferase
VTSRRAWLRSGEIVGIFPEGTRSRDGLLHDGHVGVAHLALKSGAPIVPVGIIGTDRAMPPDSLVPRRTPITLRFGAPVDLGRWTGAIAALSEQRRSVTPDAVRRDARVVAA